MTSATDRARARKAKMAKKTGRKRPDTAPAADQGAAGPPVIHTIEHIAVTAIIPSLLNRTVRDDDPDQLRLVESIGRLGLQTPIALRPLTVPASAATADTGAYEIIFGERRWRACKALGHVFIAATVHQVDERQAHVMRLEENRQQKSLTPMEEGEAVSTLLDLYGNDYSEAAAILGWSEAKVRRRARLPYLSKKWTEELADPETPYTHIRDSVEKMETVAQLPVEEQDALLDDGRLRWRGTTAELEKGIKEFLRRLDARPWPEEFEHASAVKCDACDKRSDCRGDMFAGLEATPTKRPDKVFCLDSACWMRKTGAWLETVYLQALARAKAEGMAEEPMLLRETFIPEREFDALTAGLGGREIRGRSWKFNRADEIDSADDHLYGPPVLAVFVNGKSIGEIVVARFDNDVDEDEESEGGEGGGDGSDYEAMRQRNEEDRRRAEAFIAAVLKLVPKESKKDDDLLLRMVGHYGYTTNEIWNYNRPPAPPEKKNARGSLWKYALGKLRDLFLTRAREEPERRAVCELLGVDYDAATLAATAELAMTEAVSGDCVGVDGEPEGDE